MMFGQHTPNPFRLLPQGAAARSPRVTVYALALLALLTAAALLWLLPAGTAEARADARVTGVAVTSSPASGDTYSLGETISVTVNFTEAVTVTGTPRLRLLVHCVKKDPSKDCKRRAAYESGSGTTALVFSYTVKNTDKDADGVSMHKNAIRKYSGATIKDSRGNNASLHNKALPAQSGHKVDGSS